MGTDVHASTGAGDGMTMYGVIHLTKGYYTVVDYCDFDLAKYNWCANVRPSGCVYAERFTHVNNKAVGFKLHRVIAERKFNQSLSRKQEIDHENRNGLDNRRKNLRLATHAQNRRNVGSYGNHSSGVAGVSWDSRRSKWAAYIKVDGKAHYLGRFEALSNAVEARQQAEREYFGEFSPLASTTNDLYFPPVEPTSTNAKRMYSNNTSGVRGVHHVKSRNQWTAHIRRNGKLVHLGYFKTIEDATTARIDAEQKADVQP